MFSQIQCKNIIQSCVTRVNLEYRCICSQVSSQMVLPSTYWWNSKITSCFRHGDTKTAHQLFNEMPDKNIVTWNCMISGYVRNWRIGEARRIFDAMPYRNIISWTALLNGYARCGRLEEARVLFDNMPERNVICWNTMISGYINNGKIDKARELFDGMPGRNTASWTTMIEGYFRNNLVSEARDLFLQKNMHGPSVCNAMLSGYAAMGYHDEVSKLFGQMPHRDVVSWTTMISSHLQAGEIEEARIMFEEMPERDEAVWTTLVRGYLQNGNIKEARKLFDDMPNQDIVAWNTMIGGYIQNRMLDDAIQLFIQMPQHNIVSWNSILQGFVQQDDFISASAFFKMMPLKDGTSWNIMLSGCHPEDALILYCQMKLDGFKSDQGTFASVISACSALAMLGYGRALHLSVIKTGFEHDKVVLSSLITMYSKCGSISDAGLVFERTVKRDTVAWNAMIVAEAYHGSAAKALDLFPSMLKTGSEPNHVTFLGLLTACAHNGLVDMGWQFFTSMEKDWQLIPKAAHYACMVDLLGRAGLLNEAYDFIKQWHIEVPRHSWDTLVSACRVHGNLNLGEDVAKEILHIQPENEGVRVLLSKIYAARGMWKDAARVRAKCSGAKKEPACSWIEMKGKVYSFMYNDRSHPQIDNIYKVLESLSVLKEGISCQLY